MNENCIIFAVFDTLHHEYRGYKTAVSFKNAGREVKVIGIRYGNELLQGWDGIETVRLKLYERAPLIFNMILFWIKLFCFLLFEKACTLYSHDIFPLMPVYLISKMKRRGYVYDAHEFWHGNSHLENRPAAKRFWTFYEKLFITKAGKVITVSHHIADELRRIYGLKDVTVIANMPMKKEIPADRGRIHRELGIEPGKKIVLYQGHFLLNNGLDTVLRAFAGTDPEAVLVLIGDGIEKNRLKALARDLDISERVYFSGPYPHNELINYTVCAYLGLCLIKNSGMSYFYSAPNKMFEFIQAKIPQISSDFPEISYYIKNSGTGILIEPDDEELIAGTINDLLRNREKYNSLRNNCKKASEEFVWENYESRLISIVL